MRRPSPEQLRLLRPAERVSFEIADLVNRQPVLKSAAHVFLTSIGAGWVQTVTRDLVHTEGVEHMSNLRPDRGVFLVSNHRSFFDLYTVSSVLVRACPWIERMYFPVRSTFFYEGALGNFVNMVMSMWAMFPPILRDPKRKAFNQYSVGALEDLSREPGVLIGYHPEGTRAKHPDPYELLPASSGTGAIIHQARPIVMPCFTLGLINDLPRQVQSNFDGTGAPVTMVFGPPVDLDQFYALPPTPETFKALANHLRDVITELGTRERALRKRLGLQPPSGATPPSSTRKAPRDDGDPDRDATTP